MMSTTRRTERGSWTQGSTERGLGGSRAMHWWAPVLGLGVLLVLACPHRAQAQSGSTLVVVLDGVDEGRGGELRCAVWSDGDGFPSETGGSLAGVGSTREDGRRVCRFALAGAGAYAVSVMHDENGNDEVDRAWTGMPTEGWATSRNVVPRLRAPRFDESVIQVGTGETVISVTLHY